VTIGNFDGVHLGHISLIEKANDLARLHNRQSVVVTFSPAPWSVLYPERATLPLTTIERRTALLKKAGAGDVVVLRPTLDLLRVPAEEFFTTVIVDRLHAKGIVEGPNFRFGHNRLGDIELLRQLATQRDMVCEIVAPTLHEGEWVSSTRIRQWIESGAIDTANQFLLEPYRIAGVVSHGSHRGRTIGFPTANLNEVEVLIPAMGVYAARITSLVKDGVSQTNMLNKAVALHIGPNPTFGENSRKIEAHILDFSGDLYGSILEMEILTRVREVQKFAGLDALVTQLRTDVAVVKNLVSNSH
jgi:riboflavin kinase/FMN adenylyltransferase